MLKVRFAGEGFFPAKPKNEITMGKPFLELNSICKSFGGVEVLKNVSLTLNEGEIHCLAGENGCGKSTLIKIIAGFYKKDDGEIIVGGEKIESNNPKTAIANGIQVVYQDLPLYPTLSIAENIVLSNHINRSHKLVNWKSVQDEAVKALGNINLHLDVNQKVEELSIVKKQLVSIAKALYHNARLVVLDEPTTALTEKEIGILFDVLKNLASRGMSILLVTHKLREVLTISSRLTIMRNGSIVVSGNTNEFTESSISRYMTGRDVVSNKTSNKIHVDDQPFLSVKSLSKAGVFEDVDMDFHKGEIVGITGLLGSGRSEVVKSIVGLESFDSGDVSVCGKSCRFSSISNAIEAGIGYVTDDRASEGIFADRSVSDNMISASLSDFVKNHLGTMNFDLVDENIEAIRQQFNIVMKDSKMCIKYLSGGNAQKVMLGRWLLANVKLLFLNGPTVGVDIGAKFEIYEKLKELSKQGVILGIISDDVPELVINCDRVFVFHKGRIVRELRGEDVSEDVINTTLSSLM